MSTTNVTLGNLFETIGKLHIQVEALQSEISKRDAVIAQLQKQLESASTANKAPEPHLGPYATPIALPSPVPIAPIPDSEPSTANA